ncbi:protein scarlet-like [Planococcus citri]|uniref:protein scarlet-like n=1 Tax=Planococcus citri TaxID=170843 RepID=UPI0031F9C60F
METKGVSITWQNLTVKVDIKTQHIFRNATHTVKELIHNVNGHVRPNNLVAIMGASGSGKTTLMSVLANRRLGDFKVAGDVRINGQKIPSDLMKKISGFVYQDDLFVPTLTASEHLHLVARIKLDKKITTKHRKALINEILKDVGLTECANRFIGTSTDDDGQLNLSGGERKRLSVATELLINPALLFCDEPTTGLDSYSALKVMTVIRNMINQGGKTIICSIHQPSAKILDLFHQIILLHDGKIAFCGSIENALEFFQSIGYFYNKKQNPADYFLKSLSVVPERELEFSRKAAEICLKFQESQYSKMICEQTEEESGRIEKLSGLEKIEYISWFQKFQLITYREVLSAKRNPSKLCINIIRRIAFALFVGFCVKKSTITNQESIHSMKGLLFVIENQNFFPYFYTAINHFPKKMPLFLREYSNDMNTPLIFYLSSIISLIPGLLLDSILFTVIAYVMLDLRKNWFAFFVTIMANILNSNLSVSFGIMASLATNNFHISDTLALLLGTCFYPFTGMVMNIRSIPAIFLWIRYFSWLTYAFECVLIVYFEGVEHIECSKTEVGAQCLKNGQEVLHSMGFDSANLRGNIITMSCMYLIFQLLSFIALKIRLYFKVNN